MPLTRLPLHYQAVPYSGTDKEVDATIIIADGTHPFTGNQDCGNHKLTGLADPVNPQDAVNLRSVMSGAGDKNYVFTQAIASSVWNINHGLGKRVSVVVVDSSGDEVFGDIVYIDNNNVTVSFSAPFSGEAYCN